MLITFFLTADLINGLCVVGVFAMTTVDIRLHFFHVVVTVAPVFRV